MIKQEPPKPPPMREIRDDGSAILAGAVLVVSPIALIIMALIRIFGS